MGLQADGLQRWAVERLMEAKRSKSGGVWGLARFAGHAAADDQWVRLVDMSLPLRAEARGLLPLRRRRLLAVAPTVVAGVRRSGRALGECSRSARAVAAWRRIVTRAVALSIRAAAGQAVGVVDVEEGHSLAAVLRWKRVKGKLLGLVRWEPDPVTGEFLPEWKGENDLGVDLVREGRAVLGHRIGARASRRARLSGATSRSLAGQVSQTAVASSADTAESSGRDERADARDAKRAASAAPVGKRGLGSSDEGRPAPPPAARRMSARGQQLGGAKRDYGEGSPSGSSVAARAAAERAVLRGSQ